MRMIACAGLSVIFLLAGCSSGEHSDLAQYIEKTKQQPVGQIDPLPPFKPYKSFSYGAVTLRSPFDPPVKEVAQMVTGRKSNVKPDLGREREFLESFNLAALSMVGTLEREGVLWALIDDGDGGIHRVTTGNYLGKNHGKIIMTEGHKIELIEIVSDGADGWVERPKVLQLAEKE